MKPRTLPNLLLLATLLACTASITNATAPAKPSDAAPNAKASDKLGLAILLRKARKYGEAEPMLQDVLKTAPDNALAWRNLGLVYAATQRPQQAIEAYDRASQLVPRDAWPIYLRGRVHLRGKDLENALRDFDRAIELDPRLGYAYHYRAKAREAGGDDTGALSDYGQVLTLIPYRVRSYLARADLYRKLGLKEEALGDYVTVTTLQPGHAEASQWARKLPRDIALEPVSKPAPYVAPRPGLRIQNLETLGKAETVEDMIAWFKPGERKRPKPKKRRRNRLVLGATSDGVTPVEIFALHNRRGTRRVSQRSLYRAIWPMQQRGPGGVTFDLTPDRKAIDSLWPLDTGRKASGTDAMTFRCPPRPAPVAKRLGCDTPGQVIEIGSFRWNAKLLEWRKLAVPAGLYRTIKVSISGTMEVDVPGFKHARRSSRTVWFAPDLGWWVKRTSPRGEDEHVVQAMIISP